VLVKDPDLLSDLVAALPGIARSLLCPCQDPYYNPFATLADKLPLVTVEHGLTIAISIEGEFENYWNGRPRKLRQNIGRYYRRAQEAGFNISLTRLDQVDEMEGAIQRYGMLESLGWKGQEGTAVHSENVQGKFYRDVLIDFAQRGKASVYELRFGDKVVAMRLCVATDNMLVMLKTAYDEAYAEYATGRLLLHALLVQAFKERRFKTIEFYTHANIDQIAWATDERMIMHVKLFRNPATKMAYSWMRRSLDVLRSLRDKLHIEAQSKSPLIVTALCIGSDNGCSSSD
jgi:hypothetical protein